MERSEFLKLHAEALREIREAYNALSRTERLQSRKASVKKAIAEHAVYAMQRKIAISRFGMTADQARAFAIENPDMVAVHPNRQRVIDSISIREGFKAEKENENGNL